MSNLPTIRLIKFQDTSMATAIFYWVLISKPSERIGPLYFATKEEAQTWATQNGYKYK